MGTYTLNEYDQLYGTRSSLERQVQFVYNQNQKVLSEIQALKQEMANVNGLPVEIQRITKQQAYNTSMIKLIIENYNQLVKSLKCRLADIDARLTSLEGVSTHVAINSL